MLLQGVAALVRGADVGSHDPAPPYWCGPGHGTTTGVSMTLAQLERPTDLARVLVVDDHRTFAELLSGALAAAGMDAIGTAHSAAQAVAMAQELQPDIVVMDIEMPRQ